MTDVADLARPLLHPDHLDPLIERIGDARYVLLGEASHGTHEYYAWRAELSKRLIAERGFDFVAVEGDWPDCARVNRFVRGLDDGGQGAERATAVLERYERWPTWMWANSEVAEFVDWLRAWNLDRPQADRAGFYGFDVYSLWDSLREILRYLSEQQPEAIEAARKAFLCFEPYREDPQAYAWASRLVPQSCEDEVVELLARVRGQVGEQLRADGGNDPESRFDAWQNAEVAAGAERYYRAMVRGGGQSWNVRDTHMVDTLDRLVEHCGEQRGEPAKAIVWAHNTHVGDARATDMADAGMHNVGQLVRDRHAADGVFVVGFAGYRGSVIAGSSWGAPMRRMRVPAARGGSVEDLLHAEVGGNALFVFPPQPEQADWLRRSMLHRAIGVVYDPDRERFGNYVPTVLGERYDALCSFDLTEALAPLHAETTGAGEPETYPSGV